MPASDNVLANSDGVVESKGISVITLANSLTLSVGKSLNKFLAASNPSEPSFLKAVLRASPIAFFSFTLSSDKSRPPFAGSIAS